MREVGIGELRQSRVLSNDEVCVAKAHTPKSLDKKEFHGFRCCEFLLRPSSLISDPPPNKSPSEAEKLLYKKIEPSTLEVWESI
jgi:hypothetical protein